MLTACVVCLLLAPDNNAIVIERPITRAIRTAFTDQHRSTDAERIAAEAKRRELEQAERARLNHATWAFVSTAGADWALTAACVKVGCGESTHVGLFLHGVRPEAAIPLGLGIDAALGFGLRKFVAPEYPRFAEVALYVLSGARGVVIGRNVAELRKHGGQR